MASMAGGVIMKKETLSDRRISFGQQAASGICAMRNTLVLL